MWVKTLKDGLVNFDNVIQIAKSFPNECNLIHAVVTQGEERTWVVALGQYRTKGNLDTVIKMIWDAMGHGHQRFEMPTQEELDNPKKKKEISFDQDKAFEEFWKLYPRKVGKSKAKERYKKRVNSIKLHEVIMQAVSNNIANNEMWAKDGGQYIPHPTTWLNQGRWDDEFGENKTAADGMTDAERDWWDSDDD